MHVCVGWAERLARLGYGIKGGSEGGREGRVEKEATDGNIFYEKERTTTEDDLFFPCSSC